MSTITAHDLISRGWPQGPLIGAALELATALVAEGASIEEALAKIELVRRAPDTFCEEGNACARLAYAVRHWMNNRPQEIDGVRETPMHAPIWGREMIDDAAVQQLENAMRLPVTVAGALMPDAHVGYGIPIGGVVALEDAVAPYMVGVDIACRMMMSIYPTSGDDAFSNHSERERIKKIMREETRFGLGASFDKYGRRQHDVMDDPDWEATKLLRHLKEKAAAQLGTSGTGNHFVDAGVLEVTEERTAILGIPAGRYLAFMTHSGSRGVGATIADTYSKLAQKLTKLPDKLRHLAWLPITSDAGQEYWTSMNLAGRFASACHHTIHQAIGKRLGERPVLQLENHHNYAWREFVGGREVYVHRKGATPAHEGELGIVPGSQGTNSYIVRGMGSEASLNSASHGAGRLMSRTAARNTIPKASRDLLLREAGVELMSGGIDESPQVYKDIEAVLDVQKDLVERVARFEPRIVLMADDGKSED
jgi:tRNA-splicing ligase RtcB (3'-phosphate/5'-hydroxy nucleic acid ligase)